MVNPIADSTRQSEETQSISITFEAFDKGYVLDMNDVELFYFIEDIFSYSLTGVLRFTDLMGFAEFAPLTGSQEKIVIRYGDDKDVKLSFDVYKIREIVPQAAGGVTDSTAHTLIEIVFVDEYHVRMTHQKWSRSFLQSSVSDIVTHLVDNMLEWFLDSGTFEPSREKIDFIMPWWTVKQAISWLSKRGTGGTPLPSLPSSIGGISIPSVPGGVSTTGGNPGYLYFPSTKNKELGLNFMTLNKLMQGSVRTTGETKGVYVFQNPENINYINRILGWEHIGVDNFFLSKGIHGGNRFGYDFSTKGLLNTRYEYKDGIDKTTILGNKTLYTDMGTSRSEYVIEGDSSIEILDSTFYHEFIKRYSLQQGIKIIVKGHEERYAGALIEIEWPSTEKQLVHNKQMKGLYLIKSVTHQWSPSRPGWIQKLVLLKNGYTDSRNRDLLKASKKNLYGARVTSILSKAADIGANVI